MGYEVIFPFRHPILLVGLRSWHPQKTFPKKQTPQFRYDRLDVGQANSPKPSIHSNLSQKPKLNMKVLYRLSGQMLIFFTNLNFPEIRGPISLPKRYLLAKSVGSWGWKSLGFPAFIDPRWSHGTGILTYICLKSMVNVSVKISYMEHMDV